MDAIVLLKHDAGVFNFRLCTQMQSNSTSADQMKNIRCCYAKK